MVIKDNPTDVKLTARKISVGGHVVNSCPGGCPSHSVDSPHGGVQIGYNFDQAGSFVWGLGATIPVVTTKSDLIVAGNNFPAELQWAAAMGVRAGLPIGDFLPFVLVGGVVGGGKASKVSAGLSDSQTHVGLGGEWAFSTRWSAILRYAFVDMSLQPYNIGGAGEKFGFQSHSVAISLNYHPGR
jgi:opacity protein-like surface antigen